MIKQQFLNLVLLLLVVAGCKEKPSGIKVGVAETVITPPNPTGHPMWGYDRKGKLSTGTHDDLHSRSLVVQGADGNAVLMMTVAVLNMNEKVMDLIRSGIQKRTGIPFKNMVISSTHTHSGPIIGIPDSIVTSFLRAASSKAAPRDGDANPDSSYLNFFISRNIECAVKAWDSRVPGKIGVGTVNIFGLAMNDRRMDHGGLALDNEAAIIKAEDDNGKLLGVFFNYGCHPSALDLHNLEFTEDWPYYSIEGIKEKVGKDVVVAYIQSAQGDAKVGYTAELSAVGAYMYGIRSFEYAEKKGRIMSDAVVAALPSIQTDGGITINATYERFDFPRRSTYPYTHEEALRWQKEANETLKEKEKLVGIKIGPRRFDYYKVDVWLADQAVNVSKAVEANPNPAPISMPMQAIRLGENFFVTFPNEVFTEIGLAVKKQSPFKNTFVVGVAGGHQGYIPTKTEFLEQGYAANGSPFAPETEDVLINASKKLIDQIKE